MYDANSNLYPIILQQVFMTTIPTHRNNRFGEDHNIIHNNIICIYVIDIFSLLDSKNKTQ